MTSDRARRRRGSCGCFDLVVVALALLLLPAGCSVTGASADRARAVDRQRTLLDRPLHDPSPRDGGWGPREF